MLGAPPVNWERLILVAVILVFVIFLQKTQVDLLGWGFDFGLTVLISAAIFLNPLDLAFLELIALSLLLWKPFFSMEIFIFLAIPWAAYWGKKIISSDLWTQNLIFIASGIILFYFLQNPGLFGRNLPLMLNDVVGCVVFGTILFFIFENLYAAKYD